MRVVPGSIAAGLVGAVLAGLLAAAPARADAVADFYRGSTLRLISSAGPSSGYTIWARFVAQYLPRHMPGNPTVIVQSMTGAGGIVAGNYLYNNAPRDGREIASVSREAPSLSIMAAEGVKYDALKFNWLGTPTSETNLCIARSDAPIQSIDDLFHKEFLVGTDGVGSGMHIFPTALNFVLGTKFRTIGGYHETGDVLLAVDRGEVQGSCQSAETLMRIRGDAIRSGALRVALQAGLKRNPNFPDAPYVMDLAKTPEQLQSLRFLYASLTFGRPYLAPPDVPPERIAALRKALADTFADPEFKRDAERQGYELSPISGEEMTEIIRELAQTPKEIVKRIASFTQPN